MEGCQLGRERLDEGINFRKFLVLEQFPAERGLGLDVFAVSVDVSRRLRVWNAGQNNDGLLAIAKRIALVLVLFGLFQSGASAEELRADVGRVSRGDRTQFLNGLGELLLSIEAQGDLMACQIAG